ncbi:MAG TPA: hypothetical protein VFA40_04700 [Terriglobales bacterium]|nr:hypothetical protein [Terriglobales bacterium]
MSEPTRKVRVGVMLACVLCLLGVGLPLAKDFAKPPAKPAATYPLHDQHSDESVAAGVDPYDDEEKTQIFNVKWAEQGFLPIFLVITNDGDQPVSLANMEAQLITSRREKIPAASNDELYRRLSHVNASGPKYPLPFPRTKVKGAVGKKALDEIDAAQFSAKAVEPHSTQSGFVFFDVSGISSPLAGGRFYLTGLRNAKGTELLYFEIYFQK